LIGTVLHASLLPDSGFEDIAKTSFDPVKLISTAAMDWCSASPDEVKGRSFAMCGNISLPPRK
jgi:hypothetical protein